MRSLMVIWLVAVLGSATAEAGTPAPVCEQYAKSWAIASEALDVARMQASIRSIPSDCPVRARAEQRLSAVLRQERQAEAVATESAAAAEKAAQALSARNDAARRQADVASAQAAQAAQAQAAAEAARQAAATEAAREQRLAAGADDAAFQSAVKAGSIFGTLNSYQAYLAQYPSGRHVSDAEAKIGYLYELDDAEDTGVRKDYKSAMHWYRLAADQGNAEAQEALGVMYEVGFGAPRDYVEASRLFRLAAGQGNQKAEADLGLLFAFTPGVQQDYPQALQWYRLAFDKGGPLAASSAFSICQMYAGGLGVAKDLTEARNWMLKAGGYEAEQCLNP